MIEIHKSYKYLLFCSMRYSVICLLYCRSCDLLWSHTDVLSISLLILSCDLHDRLRHCSREQSCLMLFRHILKNCLNVLSKSHIKHFISFIKDKYLNILELHCMSADMVKNTSRCSNDDLNSCRKCSYLS